MSSNDIPSLPVEIGTWIVIGPRTQARTEMLYVTGRLKHLRSLELANNKLTVLPPDIGRLISLEYLDVRHNQLSALPKELMDCENLQVCAPSAKAVMVLMRMSA